MNIYGFSRNLRPRVAQMWCTILVPKRNYKVPRKNYAKVKAKKGARDFALKHFDQVYGSAFKNWHSIRLGLLCPQSYCAVVNPFSDCDQVSDTLVNLGAFDIKASYLETLLEYKSQPNNDIKVSCVGDVEVTDFHNEGASHSDLKPADDFSSDFNDDYIQPTRFKYRDEDFEAENFQQFFNLDANFEVKVVSEPPVEYPEQWRIFFFPRGKIMEFPPPLRDPSGVLNYFVMDGASILPVLALNVQTGESVADLIASPGGKSLAILFGLKFGKLVCNDRKLSKLRTVLDSYLPSVSDWNQGIIVSRMDVDSWYQFHEFDKILLDVPCTNDRLSVTEEEDNIFKSSKFHERMRLPQQQTEMLCCALQKLKPNGSLVYSTRSFSVVQNDGVVHMALSKLHGGECCMEFTVNNLNETFYPVSQLFSFSKSCQYGQLVVPYLPLNYGPMYISKINRVK